MANFRDLLKQNSEGVYSPSNKPSADDVGAIGNVSGKFITKRFYGAHHYCRVVVLLVPYSTATTDSRRFIDGKLTGVRGGSSAGRSSLSANILINSAYGGADSAWSTSYNSRNGSLCTFMYNGIKWVGWDATSSNNAQDDEFTFIGRAEGLTSDSFTIVRYTGDGTQEGAGIIANKEIKDSLSRVSTGVHNFAGKLYEDGQRVYSPHNKPTKADVSLGKVNDWEATSSVSDPSTSKYATAGGVKTAYDKAAAAMTPAQADAKYPLKGDVVSNRVSSVTNPDPLFNGKVSVTTLSHSYPDLQGQRALLTLPHGTTGGFQLAARSLGSELHVRSKEAAEGATPEPWQRVYTTGYKPSAADVKALSLTGGELTGDLSIKKDAPSLVIHNTDHTKGDSTIQLKTGASQDLTISHKIVDGELPEAGQGVVFKGSSASHPVHLVTDGQIYAKGNQKVYHTGNKPTASDVGAPSKDDVPTWNQVGIPKDGSYKTAGKVNPSVATDLNTIDKGGLFGSLSNSSAPNKPKGTGYGYVQNYEYGSTGNLTQTYIPYGVSGSNGYMAFRSRYNGQWNDWSVVYSTNNKPTASEVGAYSKSESDNSYLKKAGDTMTGVLTATEIKMSNLNHRNGNNAIRSGGSSSATIVGNTIDGTYLDSKDAKIIVRNAKGEVGQVYHEGYKPTVSAIGAQAALTTPFSTRDYLVSDTKKAELLNAKGGSLAANASYHVRLVTKATGTATGNSYVVSINSQGVPSIQTISKRGSGSNHPELVIEANKVYVKTQHANDYTVTAFIQEASTGSPNNFFYDLQTFYSPLRKPSAGDVGAYTKSESDSRFVNITGDVMTGALAVQGLHAVDAVAADAIKMSGYGIMANRAVMYVHNANSAGKISFGLGGGYGQNVKAEISGSGILSAVPVTVAHDVKVAPNISDASINMSTAANKNCTIRMREDADKHGAYIQYRGAEQNDLVIGTYNNSVATQAISIPRGNADVQFARNIGISGGLINLAGKFRIAGETDGLKIQSVSNGKEAWIGCRNTSYCHMNTNATEGFYSYSKFHFAQGANVLLGKGLGFGGKDMRVWDAGGTRGLVWEMANPNSTGYAFYQDKLETRWNTPKFAVVGSVDVQGSGYHRNGKLIVGGKDDDWLRLNPSNSYTSGIFCGNSLLRTDGWITSGSFSSNGSAKAVRIAIPTNTSWGADKTAAIDVGGAPTTGSTATYMMRYRNISGSRIFAIDVLDQGAAGQTRFWVGTDSKYVEFKPDGEIYSNTKKVYHSGDRNGQVATINNLGTTVVSDYYNLSPSDTFCKEYDPFGLISLNATDKTALMVAEAGYYHIEYTTLRRRNASSDGLVKAGIYGGSAGTTELAYTESLSNNYDAVPITVSAVVKLATTDKVRFYTWGASAVIKGGNVKVTFLRK
ncbi:pyocin knob domain-containing protein [Vibrio parahaemolyticus]|uniref:pyocin knob domain-containing protein n=1 Tax=Vibrio parahaemolyticus TaxID=670 RepID=UPI0005F17523|nr:pyocin knob domain-containing protein [Vibrio parahaemolyticus]KJR15228.1 hypothetical protein UF28_16305 [Vibrio parahaemolyticus]